MRSIFLTSFCVLLSLSGCKKNEAISGAFGINIQFSIKDSSGEDLLNPATPNSINEENIEHYYLINGEKARQYEGTADHPKALYISKPGTDVPYTIGIGLNTNVADGATSTSILEYKDYPADTIEVKIHKTSKNNSYSDVRINGRLIEDAELKDLTLIK